MRITLSDAGKRFNRDWVFRHLHHEFVEGVFYAITGPNGSGKSTLLQVLAGAMSPSEGGIQFQLDNRDLPAESLFKHMSITAPYLELVEEMTAQEFLCFHQKFKPFLKHLDPAEIISMIGLKGSANKQIRFFSSGMKQRIKLAQTLFSDTPLVLMDEPCTNLDADGISLYRRLVQEYCADRLVVVSSNDLQEYEFCEKRIDMLQFKSA
jgi:ABC-type multidrug transport system ATPase subunit